MRTHDFLMSPHEFPHEEEFPLDFFKFIAIGI